MNSYILINNIVFNINSFTNYFIYYQNQNIFHVKRLCKIIEKIGTCLSSDIRSIMLYGRETWIIAKEKREE